MSRPCASVPNHQIQLGGSSAFMRLAPMTGSVCASQGANRPTKTASANSTPPMIALVPSFIAAAPRWRPARPIVHGHNETGCRSCVSDPGIDHAVEQVNQRVDGEKEQHHHENGALYGRNCLLYTSDAADERSSVDLGG